MARSERGTDRRRDQRRRQTLKVDRRMGRKSASSRKRASYPAPPKTPPVVSRYAVTTSSLPGVQRKGPSRRRVDIALSTPGAEIRLPSIPLVQFGWRTLSFGLSVILLFLIYHLYSSAAYRVQDPEIHGLGRVSGFTVNSNLNIVGEPIFALSPNALEEQLLEQFPEFTSATVEVGFPNMVVISVTERIPVLTWIQSGSVLLIDEDGWAFPARNDGPQNPSPVIEAAETPLLPVVTTDEALLAEFAEEKRREEEGEEPVEVEQVEPASTPLARPFLSSEMVAGIQSISNQLPLGNSLTYTSQHGLGWVDARGWQVYFGEINDIALKITVYNTIVEKVEYDGIQPEVISVEYVHAPYYRLGD